jgi:peroxiredoxin
MKSAFISLYMVAAVTITVNAAQSLLKSHDYLSWGGVLLASAPIVVLLSRMMLFQNVARTSARLPILTALGAAGLALATWGYLRDGSAQAPLLAAAAWVGFVVYSYWYSSLDRRHGELLKIGDALPGFKLKDIAGKTVDSSSFADRPTIWIFYRGNWCPLCVAQIKEVAGQYKELTAIGARLALVSPQPHKKTVSLSKKFDVPFDFLTDEGNRAARALGIDHPGGLPLGMQALGYDSETVMPTVIITDKGGRILWAHETDNYRVRPDPDVYLAVLREHQIA